MNEYQDWVFMMEAATGFQILDLEMDHPDCWYCEPGYYPSLLGFLAE
jgi:hypothetical protein